MMDFLWHIDVYLFELINGEWANGFFDYLLPIWRNKLSWIPFYILLLIWFIYKYKKRAFLIIALLVITIGTADTISSKLIKPNIERLRPCNIVSLVDNLVVISRVPCGSGYSFPSSHATNHFAIALFLIVSGLLATKIWIWVLVFWAGLIGYSQIYVGVHFPIDVLVGSLLGALIGLSFGFLWKKLDAKYFIWK